MRTAHLTAVAATLALTTAASAFGGAATSQYDGNYSGTTSQSRPGPGGSKIPLTMSFSVIGGKLQRFVVDEKPPGRFCRPGSFHLPNKTPVKPNGRFKLVYVRRDANAVKGDGVVATGQLSATGAAGTVKSREHNGLRTMPSRERPLCKVTVHFTAKRG